MSHPISADLRRIRRHRMLWEAHIDIPQPSPDVVPLPPSPHPLPPAPEPVPPEIIEPPLPGQDRPVREPPTPPHPVQHAQAARAWG